MSGTLVTDWQDLDPGQAMMVDWTAAEYHADTLCESRSELWMLYKNAPQYHAVVVEKSEPWPSSDDMELGTLVHCAVLEPKRFMSTVMFKPPPPGGKRPTGAQADAMAFGLTGGDWSKYDERCRMVAAHEQAGDSVIPATEFKRITDITGAVYSHDYASQLLGLPGPNEQTIIWREPTTGLLCRVRVDGLRDLGDAWVVLDLKSTYAPKPSEFSRSIEKLGYDFQGGFYSDAVQALDPGRQVIYAIIAAGTTKLHGRYQVAAGPLAPRAVEEGRRKYRAALADLVKRRKENNWRASWEEDRELVFDMPNWAYPWKKDDR